MSEELKELGLNLRVVGVDELTPHPRNYNRHSQEQRGELVQSLDDFAQYKNIVAWTDPDDGKLYILAGHGLWEAAQQNGHSRIAINDRSDLSRSQAMALMFSDNFTTSTDFDYPLLADIVTDLDFPVDVPGLSDDIKLGILGRAGDGEVDYDELWQGMPEFEQEKAGAYQTINVHFANEQDREEFAHLVGQVISEGTKFIWYPKLERADLKKCKVLDES